MEVFSRCISHADLVAGSPEERDFLQWLLTALDTPSVWFHLSPVEVLYWRDVGTRLEGGGVELRGLAMPYSKPAVVEGRLVEFSKDIEGNIVITQFPRDLDDAKYIVIEAARRGALAVIFEGSPPRRIVVTDNYSYDMGAAPTPLPVASIEGASRLVGKRVKLEVATSAKVTYSYSLVAFNSFENTAMISAHWDHWLVGAADNCAGVEAAVLAFGELVADDIPIALGLFTAEEGVAPHVPSLYWAWGSYAYLKRWRPTLLVNIDVVGIGTPRMYAMPYLHQSLRGLGPVEMPKPHFDSLHYERWGLPAVTISSLEDIWHIYHSPLDREAVYENVAYVAELAKRIAAIKPPQLEGAAWAATYNYLVLFKDFSHSEVVYVELPHFLKKHGGEYRRVDLLGGPTLCVDNCQEAFYTYRELALLGLLPPL
ncbi:MAG: M28 family peptidase [Pyrobaculum sp.]